MILAAVGWNIRKLLRFLSEIFQVLSICLSRFTAIPHSSRICTGSGPISTRWYSKERRS